MDKCILIKNPPSMIKRDPIHTQNVWKCKICTEKQANYTCPRCSWPYCSVECYKSPVHASCSEMFYRDCVMENLARQNSSGKGARKIIELIQKLEENPDSNPDMFASDEAPAAAQVRSLDERLRGLDLDEDGDKIWERLTAEEKREFEEFAEKSDLSLLIDVWTPWWTRELIRPKISEISDSATASILSSRPDIPALFPAPDLSALFQRHPPHPSVPFALINLLYAYALTARLYNGDHATMAAPAADNLLELSCGLRGDRVLQSPAEAVLAVLDDADRSSVKGSLAARTFRSLGMRDVVQIVADEVFVAAALADIRRVCRTAWKERGKEKKLADAFKKAEYFLAWMEEYGEGLEDCVAGLKLLHDEYAQESISHSRAEAVIQRSQPGKSVKNLIEELS
ncbi:zinc finger HIT domain-containing protein 2-like [Paramacrobiotus metropolitanus]|uniref:zinc finger HIT domain-containing protein 2-like n=1 Tax=Paramacrobiotus metropolitanus TaxID=2943436 RepID=UPI002445F6E6|nr:zinc finger HIT domain-containing protein 2-like [Paramacrobiotus metropolitanus]